LPECVCGKYHQLQGRIGGARMRIAPWLIAGFVSALAVAAEPAKPSVAKDRPLALIELDKRIMIERRARELFPRRRESPMRYLNITDDEVREIQGLAAKSSLHELVNISAVVTGCACEEGAGCTEQVYVLARKEGHTVGLQLSRFKNRWNLGRVQRWWLEYAALQAREDKMDIREYEQAHQRLLLEFPMCPTGTTTGTKTAAATPGTRK
jgi:hypothetical protein